MTFCRKWCTVGILFSSLTSFGQTTASAPDTKTQSQGATNAPLQANPEVTGGAQQSPSGPAPTTPPASAATPQSELTGAAPLRVLVGKSLLINTTERLKRVSVTDPSVADVSVVTPTQVLVHGRAPGEVSLLIWDELERSRSFDLRVDVDVSAAAEEEHRIFPDEKINVSPSRNAIVLSGHVSTEDIAKRAEAIAGAYSSRVVNALTFGPVGAQEVLLQVKFAEVDRSALSQAGINLFSTGAFRTLGNVTTGQYGGEKIGSLSDTFNNTPVPYPDGGVTNSTGPGTAPFSANTTISDMLNIFLFRPDIHLGTVIRALQTKNLLQILAEPNLIAVNGKESSFLAGGEFPYPSIQPSQGVTSVTVQYREFGVRLKFTPVVMPNGNIHLRVIPEVSALDYANALTINGFTVPALSTRRAETEFEVQDGQSFVIAGLMDNRVTNITNKLPGLGDIPILGNFFKSKSAQRSNSELMVMCTVRRVSPSSEAPTGPTMPKPFLNQEKFDGKKPSGAEK
ncbi:MAG TPA: type II and III secretion system protein family protein [Terriglobales bacterium]|nr:type II and III secretion system protein family protein [Terriglobales bacterium]